jgi:hypothetical protein
MNLAGSLALVLGLHLAPQFAAADRPSAVDFAFNRLYNFDFAGAHAILDRQIEATPDSPLPHAVKAVAYLYTELDRLKILQTDFFMDDDRVVDRRTLKPDPYTRAAFFEAVDRAKLRARRILAARPADRDALFALCMATGLVTDYAALIERRRFGSIPLAREHQIWVQKLLALDPPVYDAYLTLGTTEYVVSRIPFFLRWFVRIDHVEGSRERAVECLERVAKHGRYYAPFARVLLAVIHLRDGRQQQAERLLAGLAADFPENALIQREWQKARSLVHRSILASRR